MRLTLLAAPPLAPRIAADLGLNQTGIGVLTTLPVLLLSLAAVAGGFVIVRLGARRALALALLIILFGSLARAAATVPWFIFAATAVMGFGIAAMQPALPALLSSWVPRRIGLGTAVYMNGMLVGEGLGAGLTLPLLMPLVGHDWRLALVVWSLPAALVALAVLAWPKLRPVEDIGYPLAWRPAWRDPLVWQLGLVLGASASLFFGTNAYMASVLAARGEASLLAPGLLLFNAVQLLASLMMLRYASRWLGRTLPLLGMLVAALVSLLLFLVLSGVPALVGGVGVSFATGVLLILLVSLPPAMTGASGTVPLSAGMFTVGYAVSFLIPLSGGLLADVTGRAGLALLPVLLYGALCVPVALALGRRATQAIR